VTGRTQQDCALTDRLQNPRYIRLLEIPQSSMHDLQAVGAGARTEIGLFNKRGSQPTRGSFTRDCRTMAAAAYNQKVEFL
jgi:hypothetical protein